MALHPQDLRSLQLLQGPDTPFPIDAVAQCCPALTALALPRSSPVHASGLPPLALLTGLKSLTAWACTGCSDENGIEVTTCARRHRLRWLASQGVCAECHALIC